MSVPWGQSLLVGLEGNQFGRIRVTDEGGREEVRWRAGKDPMGLADTVRCLAHTQCDESS